MKNPVNYRDGLKKVKALRTIRGEDIYQFKEELRLVPDPDYERLYFDEDSQQEDIDNSERTYNQVDQRHYIEMERFSESNHTLYVLGFRITRTKKNQ